MAASVELRPKPGRSAAPAGDTLIALALIAGAALLAYHDSFAGPFVFDDIPAITQNETIARLGPRVLAPPRDLTVSGRPVLNLSLALNYAFGGVNVAGYHAVNLAIHVLAALALYGVVRRTLEECSRLLTKPAASPLSSGPVAITAALLWMLHPLQTESVTYVIQRAESLMGLFYLLTLYCFVRAAHPGLSATPLGEGKGSERSPLERGATAKPGGVWWLVLSVLACLFGMGTKEVMVSAPVLVLLYDRTFVAGGFAEAWRRRRGYYLALACTWVPLFLLVLSTGQRNGTAGFGVGVGWGQYALTQFPAVVRYLRLSAWPAGQTFDYGAQWVRWSWPVARDAAVVLALAAGSLAALRFKPWLGFLGFWFFAILAPTSLIPGNRQTLAEHRMYLALAPLAVLVALGVWRAFRARPAAAGLACAALALGLGWATARRNQVFRSDFALWNDTVAKCPFNPYARNNLGNMLMQAGQVAAAVREYEKSLTLKPDYFEVRNNLGTAFVQQGRIRQAEAEFQAVLENGTTAGVRLASGYGAEVRNNLGVARFQSGDFAGAVEEFEKALQLKPDYAEGRINFGNALGRLGRTDEAIAQYREAIRLKPDMAEVHNNLGNVLLKVGRRDEAVAEFATALRLRPGYPEAHADMGNALLAAGRPADADAEFRKAIRLAPAYMPAHFSYANSLAGQGRLPEAVGEYLVALRLRPDDAEAHNNLGAVLMREGRGADGISQFATALALQPGYAGAHNNLGSALLNDGRVGEARVQIEAALRLQPRYAEAHANLGNVLSAEGRQSEAVAEYERALGLGLDQPQVRANLGAALRKLGRIAEARAQLQAALRLNPAYAPARRQLAEMGP